MIKARYKSYSKLYIAILGCIICALIGYFNYLFPLTSDDWIFVFVRGEDRRVENILDIFQSLHNYYFTWGGRMVVHFFAQLLFLIGNPIADLLNSIVFVLYIFVLYKLSNHGNKSNWMIFLLMFLATWFLQAQLPTTIFWITGSANYLWGTLIVILFLYPYITYFLDKEKNKQDVHKYIEIKSFLFFIGGIIAGWTNENTVIGMMSFIVILIIYIKYISETVPTWMYSGLFGITIGVLFMLLAPGNYVRLDEVVYSPSYIDRLINIFKGIGRYFYVLLPLYGILLYFNIKSKSINERYIIISILFVIITFISTFVMIASPEFPARAWFGILTFLILANGFLLANIDFNLYTRGRTIIMAICLAVSIIFIIDYSKRISTMRSLDAFWNDRDVFVRESVDKGMTDIVFDQTFHIDYKKYDISDLSTDPNYWMNNAYATYYGLNSVRVDEKAEEVNMKTYYKEKSSK